jgi:hypothetical protein
LPCQRPARLLASLYLVEYNEQPADDRHSQ